MNTRLRFTLMGIIAAFAAFPVVAPGETHERQLRVTPEASCAATLPAHVAGLPKFSEALLSGRAVRIVAIGSSSTEGVGASAPTRSYPAQLLALLNLALPATEFEVVNLGVGGETASATVERLRRDIPKQHPDLVIWQVGTNDGLRDVPVGDYEQTLRSALGFLRQRGDDVMLVGMQWTRKFAANPHYLAVRDATSQVAAETGVTLVSRFDAMRRLAEVSGREELIGPDQLHMNDRGYRCLAEQVAATLSHAIDYTEKPSLNDQG
ncbi:lysophospholipase L1-like esterase [Rhodoblastus acidophilus]|uniref:SGNH/GDSL hydrolase family protein n=1 Tax=Rhodoblastus acidophilus TaxID=1074 RepID=UPI0022247120|nr:GDSL-type esterase/lipase family protein [Rhodoblastus acidophilus]MCW2283951.1 lysophospholipase L1-like esterase [Rhodoblastus acidophilus]MCW2332647.1 lysophospholipase L1-like esterase [Rhodoblastus acidophilus]